MLHEADVPEDAPEVRDVLHEEDVPEDVLDVRGVPHEEDALDVRGRVLPDASVWFFPNCANCYENADGVFAHIATVVLSTRDA